jgi:hypothetical protein
MRNRSTSLRRRLNSCSGVSGIDAATRTEPPYLFVLAGAALVSTSMVATAWMVRASRASTPSPVAVQPAVASAPLQLTAAATPVLESSPSAALPVQARAEIVATSTLRPSSDPTLRTKRLLRLRRDTGARRSAVTHVATTPQHAWHTNSRHATTSSRIYCKPRPNMAPRRIATRTARVGLSLRHKTRGAGAASAGRSENG